MTTRIASSRIPSLLLSFAALYGALNGLMPDSSRAIDVFNCNGVIQDRPCGTPAKKSLLEKVPEKAPASKKSGAKTDSKSGPPSASDDAALVSSENIDEPLGDKADPAGGVQNQPPANQPPRVGQAGDAVPAPRQGRPKKLEHRRVDRTREKPAVSGKPALSARDYSFTGVVKGRGKVRVAINTRVKQSFRVGASKEFSLPECGGTADFHLSIPRPRERDAVITVDAVNVEPFQGCRDLSGCCDDVGGAPVCTGSGLVTCGATKSTFCR